MNIVDRCFLILPVRRRQQKNLFHSRNDSVELDESFAETGDADAYLEDQGDEGRFSVDYQLIVFYWNVKINLTGEQWR